MPPQAWALIINGLIGNIPALIQSVSMIRSKDDVKLEDWDKLTALANKAPETYLQDAIRRAGLGGPMALPTA